MKRGPETDLAARYDERLRRTARPLGLDWRGVAELPEARGPDRSARRDDEAAALLRAIGDASVIALDERGENLSSDAFSKLVAGFRDDGAPALALAIGGPDGHGDALRERAVRTVSFGRATWPHQLVRVMALEQLYRASTILAGHPYHRE